MKKRILNILILICYGVAIYSLGVVGFRQYNLFRSKESFQQLQKQKELVVQVTKSSKLEPIPETTASKTKESLPKKESEISSDKEPMKDNLFTMKDYLLSLKERNEDVVAWLNIPSMEIDYPVMYTPSNPEYYLHKGFDKEYSYAGTPFLDHRTPLKQDASSIFIIYAHNMKNGTMFGNLEHIISEKQYQTNPIVLNTDNGQTNFQVFAALRLREYTPKADFFYTNLSFKDQKAFQKYMEFVLKNSLIPPSIEVSFEDKILVLSTCTSSDERGRFVVLAVHKNKVAKSEE